MATKTLVCPECGALAVPGRFSCAECGALLASLGGAPIRRSLLPTSAPVVPVAAPPDPSPDPSLAAVVDAARAAAAVGAAGPDPAPDPSLAAARPAAGPVAELIAATPAAPPSRRAGRPRSDTQRPPRRPRASTPAVAPSQSLLDLVEGGGNGSNPASVEPGGNGATPAPSVLVVATPDPPRPSWPPTEAAAGPIAWSPAEAPERAWPTPTGTDGELPRRAPAGAYLAPTAILRPSEPGGRPAAAVAGRAATSAFGLAGASAGAAAGSTTALLGADAGATPMSLADSLEALGLTADMPRRLVAIGAGVAALGFVLPWVNGVVAGGFITDYTTRWGMAGPGHWIVVSTLVALVLLANAGGFLARLPIAVPAVALAALLVGLLWPYLFGGGTAAVGIWTVLAGAIVLGVGGSLAARRHDPAPQTV